MKKQLNQKLKQLKESRVLKDYEFVGIINNIPRESVVKKRKFNSNREELFIEFNKTYKWAITSSESEYVDATRAAYLESIGERIIIE